MFYNFDLFEEEESDCPEEEEFPQEDWTYNDFPEFESEDEE